MQECAPSAANQHRNGSCLPQNQNAINPPISANVKGVLFMLDLGENLRKLILAGVGVAAVTKEKGADVLDELVKKGELTIEQGKVLNEELKHNIKDAIRENVTIVTPPDDVISAVDSLSDEQLEALKAHIAAREATKKTAASAASDETTEN